MKLEDLFVNLDAAELGAAKAHAPFLIDLLRVAVEVEQLSWVRFLQNPLNVIHDYAPVVVAKKAALIRDDSIQSVQAQIHQKLGGAGGAVAQDLDD